VLLNKLAAPSANARQPGNQMAQAGAPQPQKFDEVEVPSIPEQPSEDQAANMDF